MTDSPSAAATASTNTDTNLDVAQIKSLCLKLQTARTSISSIIFGQQAVVDQTLICLVAGGHLVIVGVPGLAKTLLVELLGKVFNAESGRIQCTPDLMPSDILGAEVLEEDDDKRRTFRFIKGPIFCQVFMADEINRTSPRTQSALLQAMQERKISIGGKSRALPEPFHVLATQNPLEHEGTYPLPEAQLDRFLMQIDIQYPDLEAERQILLNSNMTSNKASTIEQPLFPNELLEIQRLVRLMPVGDQVVNTILKIVRSGRPETSTLERVKQYVTWGPGPRASQALLQTTRARAFMYGRFSPVLEDIQALAIPVLKHRIGLSFAAQADGITAEDIVNDLVKHALS